jgi:hypothetical protein
LSASPVESTAISESAACRPLDRFVETKSNPHLFEDDELGGASPLGASRALSFGLPLSIRGASVESKPRARGSNYDVSDEERPREE